MKQFGDDNFKLDEDGRNIFKRVENAVGKGEIAHYEQFLFFPLCFQNTWTADTKTRAWERVKGHQGLCIYNFSY